MRFYLKQIAKMIAEHILFPAAYVWGCRRPVRANTVVFADAHRTECPLSMQRLRTAFLARGYEVTDYFFDLQKLAPAEGMKRMLLFMRLYAQMETVVLQDNFLPVSSCRKRRQTQVIQLWHGCGALKKFGYDAKDDIPRFYIGNVYKNYDLITVSSPYCRRFFASAMRVKCPDTVRAYGSPYTDCYYDVDYRAGMIQKFESCYGKKNGRYVIVWVPTFRGNAGMQESQTGGTPGETWVDRLSENPHYLVIKSLHPHMKKQGTSAGLSTGELLFAADLLITDYSSVLFEYLLLDRPMVLFAADLLRYRKDRGYYLPYEELPGPVVTDGTKLEEVVDNVRKKDTYSEARSAFRNRYMSSCDGHATERVMRACAHMRMRENRKILHK